MLLCFVRKSSAWLLLRWPYIPPSGLSIGVSSLLMSPTVYNYAVFILPGALEGKLESPLLSLSLSDSYHAVTFWLVTSAMLLSGSPGLPEPPRHQEFLQVPRLLQALGMFQGFRIFQAPAVVIFNLADVFPCFPTICLLQYSKS